MQILALLIKILLSTCLLLILPTSIFGARPQPWPFCFSISNYTKGSIYESNLNKTLSSLASNISPIGFYTTTFGTDQNEVYGLIQCRGDVSFKDCQFCVSNITKEIAKQCPNQKEAAMLSDFCRLHYAEYNFFKIPTSDDAIFSVNPQNASDPVVFDTELRGLMDNLSSQASSNPSRFAVGQAGIIYGLVQCARTLSDKNCRRCLQDKISSISKYCDGKIGCQFMWTTCAIRFETYAFFNSSALPLPPPPRVVDSPPPSTSTNTKGRGRENKRTILIISIVIPTVIASIVAFIIFVCLLRRKRVRRSDVDPRAGTKDLEEEIDAKESVVYDLSTLRIATDNFSDSFKLGEGSFGPVYKGKLSNGQDIAVKRVSRTSNHGFEVLKTEIALIAKLMHRNLVKMLGFCLEQEEHLLVYEYLPNGSLDRILFDEKKRILLGWEKRYNIIVGISRGLLYLHQDSQIRIIHRGMKASNILLDEDMNPKISGFGLAKLFGENQVEANTERIAGTHGYMAPEYTMYGQYSTKSDVFSFGVLVLEIVAGRKNCSFDDSVNLLSYAWNHWSNGSPLDIVDTLLGEQWSQSEVTKCIQLGLLCVQEDASARPTMSEAHQMLNTYSETCPIPSAPAFFEKDGAKSYSSKDASSNIFTMATSQQSENEMTVSDVIPR